MEWKEDRKGLRLGVKIFWKVLRMPMLHGHKVHEQKESNSR